MIFRRGNIYNKNSDKMLFCVEAMIKGKWVPVILESGIYMSESFTDVNKKVMECNILERKKTLLEKQSKFTKTTKPDEKTNSSEVDSLNETIVKMTKELEELKRAKTKDNKTSPQQNIILTDEVEKTGSKHK